MCATTQGLSGMTADCGDLMNTC